MWVMVMWVWVMVRSVMARVMWAWVMARMRWAVVMTAGPLMAVVRLGDGEGGAGSERNGDEGLAGRWAVRETQALG